MSEAVGLPEAYRNSRLLSYKQVMELMGVSRGTVTNLMKNRKDPLPSIRVNRNVKFQFDKVMWWIEKHEQ